MFKRVVAIILSLCFASSCFGVNAFAADELYWNLEKGTLFVFGTGEMPDYEGEEAPWRQKDKNAKDVKEIFVDEGVTHVGDQAFQYCTKAKAAYVASTVETIGESAFYGCTKLKSVTLPEEIEEIGVSAFDHCSSLESVIIPEGIEIIENATFNCCSSLEWVFIPDSVEEIEDSAFNACSNLKTIYYAGSWSDWEEIEIASYKKPLHNAEISFNCTIVS